MKKNFSIIFLLTFFSLSINVFAQPGSIDSTFNTIDFENGIVTWANNDVKATAIQSDGKIIIGGNFTSYNGTTCGFIARINSDGTLDTTFNVGTGANNYIEAISIQSDGKIVIAGSFSFYNGISRKCIARLNVNGTLDTTFNPGTGADGTIKTISIQNDGKIIIGGYFNSYNGIVVRKFARINSDGSPDATFNNRSDVGGVVPSIRAISIQSDGKIIIGGDFTSYGGIARNNIARINANGSLDTTFNIGTGMNNYVLTISIQNDGKIIVGGSFSSYNGTTCGPIARLNPNGMFDTTFNSGTGANSSISTISIQSDQKIIISGSFTTFNGNAANIITRLNSDGTLDSTFYSGNWLGLYDNVYTNSIQIDGKIIICGSFNGNGTPIYISRLNANGTLDATFNFVSGADYVITTTSMQNDGKIIIGGAFIIYSGFSRNRIARLNIDGTIDSTFNPGTGANAGVNTTAIQSDGKIIIGGYFTSYNGITRNRIARINIDGTLDTTFNCGTGTNDVVRDISIQSDGKIIIGGNFTSFNGISKSKVARINANGSLDTTFNAGSASEIRTISIQSDGKIIIGGGGYIARLNANGTIDATFNSGTGANSTIYTTSIQSDGKIIIGGYFTSYNGTTKNRIARLNSNGTLDATFNSGIGTNVYVSASSIQIDGKIIIGGNFTTFNGIARSRIARLNFDGTLDTTFNPGIGANDRIETISIQSDGNAIIGGYFNSYNNTQRNKIARIYCGEFDAITTSPFGPITYCAGSNVSVSYALMAPFSADNIFTAQLSDSTGSFASPTAIGSLSSTSNGIISAVIPPEQSGGSGYRIRVVSSSPYIIGADNGYNITVNPIILENAGVISGLTTVCQGQSGVTYTVPAIPNATSYIWTKPSGAIGTSTTNSITIQYINSASSGDITVKGHNSCGDSDTSTIAITVDPLPGVAGVISGNATVCRGENAVTYTAPPITNATSYLWTLPNGATGTSTTNSITVDFGATAVSGNITFKGTNTCGNGSTSTKAITVYAQPVAAGIISGNPTVCQGQSGVHYSVPAIANATSYIWTLPSGATGTSSTNNISVAYSTSSSSGEITVKGHNSCFDGATSTLAITISANLPVAAETISGSATVCQGQNAVIYTVPTISNATSYVWTLPSGATGTSSTNSIIANFGNSATSGNITVKGTNACGVGETSTFAVSVNLLPASAGVISGNATVCQGQNTVNYTVPDIVNAVSYVWTLPNGATGTSTTNSITVDFGVSATSGNITVKGTNSCGDGSISTFPITVNVKPNTPIISLDGPVLHSNIISGNQWYDQNGLINGAINQNYSVTANGEYYVIVTTNGCSSDVSNTIQITNTSIEFIENKILSVYPNPVLNELIIEMIGNTEKLNFEVLNSIGQVVFKGKLLEKTTVQTSNFAPGVYLIKLENGKTFEFKKIIKE